ncbi:MAG: hypothetical protein ACJAR2_002518 [Ilumatobacter sp.]|jgi:hypothetical protein
MYSSPQENKQSPIPGRFSRARRFYAIDGWNDDEVERQQEVLGVEVPEARLSLRLDEWSHGRASQRSEERPIPLRRTHR